MNLKSQIIQDAWHSLVLSFACRSVMLLAAFHKQVLTELWQQKEKNVALSISAALIQSMSTAFCFSLLSNSCSYFYPSAAQTVLSFLYRHASEEYWAALTHSPHTDGLSLTHVPHVLHQGCPGFLLCVSLSNLREWELKAFSIL